MAFEQQYKKFLVRADVVSNTLTTNISDYITLIAVKKQFVNNSFPLFVISMMTTNEIRNIIRDNDDVKIHLSVYIYTYSENSGISEEDSNTAYPEELLYDTILRVYEKPYSITRYDIDEDSQEDNSSAPFIPYTISCIPEDLIKKNNSVVNCVYEYTTPMTAAVNILTDNLLSNDMELYLDANDSKKLNIIKSDMLIPPQSPIAAIKYLDDMYGIYKYGRAALFLDTSKRIYLYDILNGSRSMNRTFLYNHVSSTNTSHTSANVPEYDRDSDTLKYTSSIMPIFIDNRLAERDAIGTNTHFYSYDEVFNCLSPESLVYSNINKKTRFFWNPYCGKTMYEDRFINSVSETRAIGMSYVGINPEFFAPDTRVSILSEHETIAGEYFIYEVSYVLSTTDRKEYTSETSLALQKIIK